MSIQQNQAHLIGFHVCKTIPFQGSPQSANDIKENCLHFFKKNFHIDDNVMMVTTKIMVYSDVTPHALVHGYRHVGETYCLHSVGRKVTLLP
jgi:hypothetical protein